MIEGREAIPVRAIPLLTYWEVLSPDSLASALTGEDAFSESFRTLFAHRISDGGIKNVPQRWWANFMVRELDALSERIKQTEISHEVGYDQWRRESLERLPAATFLWRDEFEACFWQKFGPNGETIWLPDGNKKTRNESIQLDFDPFIPSIGIQDLVVEGFSSFQMRHQAGSPAESTECLEPISSDSDSNISEKPLATRERNTLLTIIAVLCKEAKLDYSKPAKTAGMIQSTAASMGLSIGESTIEAHLKKIPNAIAGRMK